MILPRPKNEARLKIRPLGGSQFGGGGILIALNDCTKTSTGNRAPHGQDFRQTWCLQCTVLPDLIDGVYKKMPKLGKIASCISSIFLSEPMTTEREIDALVREFEQEGLITCSNRSPALAHCEDTPLAPPHPMQTWSARKKSRTEVHTKRNQDR